MAAPVAKGGVEQQLGLVMAKAWGARGQGGATGGRRRWWPTTPEVGAERRSADGTED
jgi:hypothetical protein